MKNLTKADKQDIKNKTFYLHYRDKNENYIVIKYKTHRGALNKAKKLKLNHYHINDTSIFFCGQDAYY